jgi:hypothetical protein
VKQVGVSKYDGLVPVKIVKGITEEISGMRFKFGWKSSKVNDPHGHWNHRIIKQKKNVITDGSHLISEEYPCLREYIEWLKADFFGPSNLLRFYVNAHTYGIDGYPHTDTKRDRGEQTVVLYMPPEWEPKWAGETVVLNEAADDISDSVLPRYGRLFVFPSNRFHAARSVSRACNVMRATLVCKMGPEVQEGEDEGDDDDDEEEDE